MTGCIAYLGPLIISGIAGITLTSLAFDKLNESLPYAVDNFRVKTNISSGHWITEALNKNEKNVMRTIILFEIIVISLFCISEISVFPSFSNALVNDYLNNPIISNHNVFFIIFSYIIIIFGIILSAGVYIFAKYYKWKSSIPPKLKSSAEMKKYRNQILEKN